MGGFGIGEMIILLFIVLIVFGAGKLPQLGDALGRSIKNFKRAASANDEIEVAPKPREVPAGPKAAEVLEAATAVQSEVNSK